MPDRPRPAAETDPIAPSTPYAASKAASELAGLEVWRRTGLPVVIARPFTHTGPGQEARFALPAFAERMREAKASGATRVRSGNLAPVRDLLDVRDVVDAYVRLVASGEPGETYNIARGEGNTMRELFDRIADLVGVRVDPEPDSSLARAERYPAPGGRFDQAASGHGMGADAITGANPAGTGGCPSGLTSKPFSSSAPARS